MPRRRRSRKWISWLVILVLLIVAGVVIYLVWDNYFRDKGEETQEPETSEQIEEDTNRGDEEYIEDDDEEEDSKKVKQYEGVNPNKAEELSGVVTYAGVVDGTLMIRANIDQYLGSGDCKLNILSGETVVLEEVANIASSASTSTCEGFDIPANKLRSGNYKIKISIDSGGKTGTINGEISI